MNVAKLISVVVAGVLLNSCGPTAGPNTQRGAVTGGILGATAGGIIGHQSGRGWEGAAIGGATGAAAGALYGNSRDKQEGY